MVTLPIRTTLYLVLAAAVLALVFYATGQITARLDAAERQAVAADRAFVKLVQGRQSERRALLARVDSALTVAHRWHRIADARLATADSAGHQADSAAAGQDWQTAYQARTQEVMAVRGALAAKTAEADGLAVALDSTRSGLALAVADVDSLTERLTAANRRHECRIAGLLPCPSRTVVGLVGFTLGAVTVAAANGGI